MSYRRLCTDEQGSLPLVLLVAIILSGIIIALFSTVRVGTETVRRDRDWQLAFQVADAGIQQSFVLLRDYHESDSVATTLPCDDDADGICLGDAGDYGSFVWEYGSVAGDETQWTITSRGSVGDSTRVLEANIGPRQVFPVAMLAKRSLTYNGGGGGNPPFTIGSFGSITLNGGPANGSIASIVKYGAGPHDLSIGGQPITEAPEAHVDDLNNIAQEAYDDGALCGAGSGRTVYEVYPQDVVAAGDTPGVGGTVYCVGRVDFSGDAWPLTGASDTNPVKIYVRNAGSSDSFRIRTQAEVNWSGVPGDPGAHLIFIESGPVRWSANSEFAGAVYAPNSTCDASGNQDIVGSVVCNDIIVGGTFGYATGLSGVTEGPFTINNLWENSLSY